MSLDPAVEPREEAASPAGRPVRVIVCPDRPNWAFHNIATNIIRYAPQNFEVSVHFMDGPSECNLSELVETIMLKDIDIVHTFWREDVFELLRPEALAVVAGKLRLQVDDLIGMISSRTLTTSVYDHMHSTEQALRARAIGYHMVDGYTVSSERLNRLYRGHDFLPSPDAVIPDGVDLGMFEPASGAAARDQSAPLTVGWVGNSAWGKSQGGDPKGYYRLFEPAIALLQRRGVHLRVQRADPQVRRVAFDEMPAFYRELDVLVCSSATEGTPNPVLEAMASGVGIVSTDVGIVPQAFGPLQSRFILAYPDVQSLADAVETLGRDRELLRQIGRENRDRAADWTWDKSVGRWWPFWLDARRRAGDARAAIRRREVLRQSYSAYCNYLDATRPRRGRLVDAVQARIRKSRSTE